MKKTLALVLALAMVFSTITVAFAEDAIGADAQVCADLGVLKGETGTVDAAYTATVPTRIQAAVMFLRLKGLEAEALAFTGEANFADGNIAWAEGSNLLAYLKANPQLGWQGDGKNFNPNNPITAQEYYKVLLEALGYKQTTPEVVGDFAYADVITFAASKSLTKVAAVTDFTVNDLAIATVEALKANMKDGGKTLVATLIEAGKVNKAKAVAAELYVDAVVATDAALKAVKAIGNTAVEVEFTAAVEKAFAENTANYAIVEKGATTALAVSAAVLDGTKKVVLTTAAQTSGKAYTLTVGAVAKNFGGISKNTGAPELDTVKGSDTERVEITFTKIMDIASALDVANYAIAGVTVESVAWLDSSRKAVELTTKGLAANKTYKVTVTNVKSVDLVNLKSASKNFMAKSDKIAPVPEITKGKCTNTRIVVTFTDDNELTAESAENLANYKLTVGSTENTLDITAAKLVEDGNDDLKAVELTTASQKTGTKYVLHVEGITDTSVLGNKMTKVKKLDYYGVKVDDSKPVVNKVEYLTKNIIQVTFADQGATRMDQTTMLDPNNYDVNNSVTVEKVALSTADDVECKIVRLTVSDLGEKTSYIITINNVADEYGNVMKEKKTTLTYVKNNIETPATISKVVSAGTNKVDIYFTKEIDEVSAKDVANYSINNEIGTPIKVSVTTTGVNAYKKVSLTTEELTANKEYKVTINGVKDLADNVMTSIASKFVVSATENDVDAPEIADAVALNKYVIQVTFEEIIDVAHLITPALTLDNGMTATYVVSTDDDDMVLEFKLDGGNEFTTETDIKITDLDVRDLAGNKCKQDDYIISTVIDEPTDVELIGWEQVSVKKFKLQFSEKIDDPAVTTIPYQTTSGKQVPYELTVDVDDDDPTIVWLTANQRMDTDKTFNLNLVNFDNLTATTTDFLANFHGVKVAQDDTTKVTTIETTFEDTDAPYIVNVVAKSKTKVVITFNEDLSRAGTYEIKYVDKDGKDKDILAGEITVDALDDSDLTLVTLNIGNNKVLESRYTYTITVNTQAQDIAYNKLPKEAEFDFAGTDKIEVGNYITGVKVLNPAKLQVKLNKGVDASLVALSIVDEDKNVCNVVYTPTTGTGKTTFTVTPALVDYATGADLPEFAFRSDVTYTVTVSVGATSYVYDFKGTAADDITIEKVGTEWKATFPDAAELDYIQIEDAEGFLRCSVDEDGFAAFDAADLTAGTEVVNIMAVRDGVVLYYAVGVTLP